MTHQTFYKMTGSGNDFVMLDGRTTSAAEWPAERIRSLCDRRFGVGSDGLILALPSEKADFRMRMWNLDGSESEMCGNGLRCVAKFVVERGLVKKGSRLTVETGAGVLEVELHLRGGAVESVTVDMGAPRLERAEIPMLGKPGRVVDEPLTVDGQSLRVTAVSMGFLLQLMNK